MLRGPTYPLKYLEAVWWHLVEIQDFLNGPDAPKETQIRKVIHAFNQNVSRMTYIVALPTVTASLQSSYVLPGDPSIDDLNAFLYAFSVEVDDHSRVKHGYVNKALAAVMSAQVIAAWTTFEVLGADLWRACLNRRPDLGVRALGAEPAPGDNEEEQDQKRKKRFPIPLQKLQKWNYNLSRAMGDILRDKWRFSRREQLADAYRAAFGADDDRLNEILDDRDLASLCALRNAIVHNGGIADALFVSRVRKDPSFSDTVVGNPIRIDGERIARLGSAVVEQGIGLILFVTEWMASHPLPGKRRRRPRQ